MLTYAHERSVMNERKKSQVLVAEMGYLRRVAGISFRDTVRSSAIPKELGLEPLLFCLERNQLRWFEQLVRMPTGEETSGKTQN